MKLLGLLHEYCHRVEVERDQLKVERDLLKQQSDALIKLKEIHATASDASLTLEVPFDIQIEVARSFCSLLENCPNYREVQFTLPVSKEHPYEHITLHAIKHNGKTPHQLRLEAEAKVATMRAALEGALVLANCYAETKEDPTAFRDNNDNYMRIVDALKL